MGPRVLASFNPMTATAFAHWQCSPRYAEFRKRNLGYGPGTGPARFGGERVVHVLDLMAAEAYRNGEPNRVTLVVIGGARTNLVVALVCTLPVAGRDHLRLGRRRSASQHQLQSRLDHRQVALVECPRIECDLALGLRFRLVDRLYAASIENSHGAHRADAFIGSRFDARSISTLIIWGPASRASLRHW